MNNPLIDDLKAREVRRREALRQIFSSSQQTHALKELEQIDHLDKSSPVGEAAQWSATEVAKYVPSLVKGGKSVVQISAIPEPWRSRMEVASRGSTRLEHYYFATDWQKFIDLWIIEHKKLEALRISFVHQEISRMGKRL
ncbi:hypothetical protein HKW97_25075 (plasmid) [Pseudomonas luteola]|uniref:hypothetical protein n=1 Tax=Pseudomonas luteola TaxID=47886 RepID=UPI00388D84F0